MGVLSCMCDSGSSFLCVRIVMNCEGPRESTGTASRFKDCSRQSNRLFLQSSELGPFGSGGGTHSLGGEGGWGGRGSQSIPTGERHCGTLGINVLYAQGCLWTYNIFRKTKKNQDMFMTFWVSYNTMSWFNV